MTPQTNSRMATTTTRNRLFSEKSTTARIMCGSLLHGALEDEGVLNYALARMDSRTDLLHLARQHLSTGYFDAPELGLPGRHVHPVAVMEVQHRGSRDDRMELFPLPLECGPDEHPQSHEPGIFHLQPNLGRVEIRIEDGTDIADARPENLVRVCVQADVSVLADLCKGEVVFVDVAHHPDMRQVRDRERARRSQPLRSRRGRYLLVGNYTRHRRHNV